MGGEHTWDLVMRFQQELFQGDGERAASALADSAVIENFFPHTGNKKSFLRALRQAVGVLTDVSYSISDIRSEGTLVRTTFRVRGRHAQPLDFSFMKLPVVPASQKTIVWPESQWEYTVTDGTIARIRNVGPLRAGMPGILKAFGVRPPLKQRLQWLRKHLAGAALKPNKSALKYVPLIPLVVLAFMLMFVPSPIDAAAWHPAPLPAAVGILAPNNELGRAQRLGLAQLTHPEDMAFDRQGRIYTGSDDGTIYRITLDADGTTPALEPFATVGGYPLALAFDKAGKLIAAVKDVGLLAIDPQGNATLLTNSVDATPITYANGLAIAEDGTIYFSDSSNKYDRGWPYDVLEARPNGRLLAYLPDRHTTVVVKENLYFPNGVVLSPGGDFLLVNETTRYRIARYWLKGAKQGTWDTFATNLPMLPDNISIDEAGNYLLGGGRRMALVDRIQSSAGLKDQIAKLPLSLLRTFPTLPQNRYGLVLVLDAKGAVARSLHDPTGTIFAVSSARSYGGYIYIGTLFGQDLARYPYQP